MSKKKKILISWITYFCLALLIICSSKLFVNADSNVMEISICAADVNLSQKSVGHAWLMLKNISSNNITIGNYCIKPNETVTLGNMPSGSYKNYNSKTKKWNTISVNDGLVWNSESYKIYSNSSYSNRVCHTEKISKSKLSKIVNYLNNYEHLTLHHPMYGSDYEFYGYATSTVNGINTYSLTKWNCVDFATDLWNYLYEGTSKEIILTSAINDPCAYGGKYPWDLYQKIKKLGYKSNFSTNYEKGTTTVFHYSN